MLLTSQKSYARKLKEMILSLRLEHSLSKDAILLLYLNHIYLGSGAYGVAAAANEYFGKDIADSTLAEAAMLAGLPRRRAVTRRFAIGRRPGRASTMYSNRMYDAGFITQAERDAAAARAAVTGRP